MPEDAAAYPFDKRIYSREYIEKITGLVIWLVMETIYEKLKEIECDHSLFLSELICSHDQNASKILQCANTSHYLSSMTLGVSST